ncbi:MAG: sulfite oxidase heme-binding subunit YedZ [Chloroflexota bacterium]
MRGGANLLGANPIAEVENELGLGALVFLLAAMACTPARRLFGWAWPMRIRRELGLFAFFYVSLHVTTYLLLDKFLDLSAVVSDILQRPFITVGFAAFVLLIPVAYTSSSYWIRRLGYDRWQMIHRLTYVAGVLAIVHFIWRAKLVVLQPVVYGIILGALLLVRVLYSSRKRRRA